MGLSEEKKKKKKKKKITLRTALLFETEVR
jgi:hypothetical protein